MNLTKHGFSSNFILPNKPKAPTYWTNQENINNFLLKIKQLYNLQNANDWNSITHKLIQSHGGSSLLKKYSVYELKCMACPEGKTFFKNPSQTPGYWENEENILQFLNKIKQKYNLQTPDDWNSITTKEILSNGGRTLFTKYSIFELKCMACPEGKSIFKNPRHSSIYWENEENIMKFLSEIKENFQFQTPEDWNSITNSQIKHYGGWGLLQKYSLYEIKCMACPEGKLLFDNPMKLHKYWEIKENIHKFLSEIQKQYNLQTPEDWNSLTARQIQSHGGWGFLKKYSVYQIKCIACPEGKLIFDNPKPSKSPSYWENKENIQSFLSLIKQKYNLKTPHDWNKLTTKQIQSHGGRTLFTKYSVYELKCMACPEGKSIFDNPKQYKPNGYWNDETNRNNFIDKLKEKYHLKTLLDWKRLSKHQIISQGGSWLYTPNNIHLKVKISHETPNKEIITELIPFKNLISGSHKRSSQRWLFLQIQKLFPGEEIVEDYFHSEISRLTGSDVQFDIFIVQKNIAIEYHGKHHYEDIPAGFSNLETYKFRDVEKENLCNKHGIHLIVIPYWWDNKLDSLLTTINSKKNSM